jgi:hypothetical protein
MKVKDLIQQLSHCNQEADVFVYSQMEEGGDSAGEVMSAAQAKENLYFKGDAPWNEDADNFVVIA